MTTRVSGPPGVSVNARPRAPGESGFRTDRTFASAVVTLEAASDGWIRASNGFLVYSAVLARIAREHPALAERLHSPKARKPLTISELSLRSEQRSGRLRIRAGQRASFRLTSLASELTGVLDAWAARPPDGLRIGGRDEGVDFHVLGLTLCRERSRLAGRTTDRALVAKWSGRSLPAPPRLTVRFRTPTTFRSRGVDAPLPLPRFVFGGLARMWKELYAGEPGRTPTETFQPPFLQATFGRLFPLRRDRDEAPQRALGTLDRMVRVHRFDLRTRAMDFRPRGGLERGFVGRVAYDLVDPEDEALRRTLELLLEFGFFSGVGRKRAWGMGQIVRGGSPRPKRRPRTGPSKIEPGTGHG